MKLITEFNENITITEGAKKELYIEGIFLQGDIKNQIGRKYTVEVLDKEVSRYTKEYVDEGRALGELGHPGGPVINLDRTSHLITELFREGNNFQGKAKVMGTPYGNIVKNLIKEGANLGVSSRGMGSVKKINGIDEVQKDFVKKYRELKIESHRGKQASCADTLYMGTPSKSRQRYQDQRTRTDSKGRDFYQDRKSRNDSRGRSYYRRYYRSDNDR